MSITVIIVVEMVTWDHIVGISRGISHLPWLFAFLLLICENRFPWKQCLVVVIVNALDIPRPSVGNLSVMVCRLHSCRIHLHLVLLGYIPLTIGGSILLVRTRFQDILPPTKDFLLLLLIPFLRCFHWMDENGFLMPTLTTLGVKMALLLLHLRL